MRRISLALALFGAVAATGCGQTSTSNTGGNRGVAENTFHVTIQNGQNGNTVLAITGGYVTSTPAGIDCGVAPHNVCEFDFVATTTAGTPPVTTANTVTLTATATGSVPFFGFAGDCAGPTCTMSGATNADRYILAQFGNTGGGHPNWSNPYFHVANYLSDAFDCQGCHGPTLAGAGIAPSCSKCHAWPYGNGNIVDTFPPPAVNPFTPANAWDNAIGGHFTAAGHASTTCGRCHAGAGFKDYIGADGSADNHLNGYVAATTGTDTAQALDATPAEGFNCTMCHNPVTFLGGGSLNTIKFPQAAGDGITVTVDTTQAICGQCHTGVRDTRNIATVGKQLVGVVDVDAQLITANNKSVRPHYLSAAATFLGGDAALAAQYAGKVYTARNEHGGLVACTTCHDAHTGQIVPDKDIAAKCGVCHFNEAGAAVSSFLDLEETRQFGFENDIDGDGVQESLKAEIVGLQEKLLAALQMYGTNVGGANMCMRLDTSGLANQPYVLVDALVACGTTPNNVAYNKFTARSLRASFNYMWVNNDPGQWAHNPRYAIEILFDSIADLNAGIAADVTAPIGTPVAFDGVRSFAGHFGGVEAEDPGSAAGGAAFGDWDPGPVPNNCSQCHAGKTGMEHYLVDQATLLTTPSVTGMQCTTCHQPAPSDTRFTTMRAVTTLNYPPRKAAGKQVNLDATIFPRAGDRLCATCHSGRENKTSIDDKIAAQAAPTGEASWNISFTNPHYLGAGGVMMGDSARMMYQYSGKAYTTTPIFWGAPYGSPHGQSCTACHNPQFSRHSFEVDITKTVVNGLYHGAQNTQTCKQCHDAHILNGLETVRTEYEERCAELLTALVAYSQASANPVCYSTGYPYWFVDTNANGTCDAGETTTAKFSPKASKAAFNYKWTQAEPGAWAHNEAYVFQVVFDTIQDLGGTPSFARPAVTPASNPPTP